MKIISVSVFAVILLFSISAIGQINPDDRHSTYLCFESSDSSVVSNGDTLILEVLEVEESGVPIFEKVANPSIPPYPTYGFDSPNVGKITTTASTWELIFVNNEFIIDFSVRPWFKVDVYAPAADRAVLFKIEVFDDYTIGKEIQATTTVANEWETLTFDFSGTESGKYGKIVLFMDFGGTDVGDIWYFDNVRQAQPPIRYDDGVLANFEIQDRWWWNFYSVFDDTADNPDASGINTSEKVGYFLSTDETITWELFFNNEKFVPFDFSEGAVFKLKVYAPYADRLVLFQLEEFYDYRIQANLTASTTVYDEWEELSFDFGDMGLESGLYNKIVVFPDFNATNVDEEWYFDDIIFEGKPTTSVISSNPVEYKLYAKNYPNPFNPSTTISYSVPTNSKVKLVIYNTLGKEVATLVNEEKPAGSYIVNFDGSELSSGVYLYTLTTGTQVITQKMLLIK
ncbi:MAG: T9SS type A sorting domain-containing protein [Candidatus Marinimicrobia bacterium]|nr:T9SS type A sorting domain-containing protein [Candidatus Neomarinimicrobiota bacterium]